MSNLASENVWGLAFVLIGIYQLVAYYRENEAHLYVARCLSLTLWLFVAVMVGMSNIAGTGLPNYGLIAFVDFIIVVTRGGNQP